MITQKFAWAVLIALSRRVVAGALRPSKTAGAGEYVDDSVITAKVKAAILNRPGAKVAEINVETLKGLVQLSGLVTWQADANSRWSGQGLRWRN